MAAILEMPQYVAYQKNVVYAFIKLSAKSHSFNILRTMGGLSCPTNYPKLGSNFVSGYADVTWMLYKYYAATNLRWQYTRSMTHSLHGY